MNFEVRSVSFFMIKKYVLESSQVIHSEKFLRLDSHYFYRKF